MPDDTGFPTPDELINGKPQPAKMPIEKTLRMMGPDGKMVDLTAEQVKAIKIVLSLPAFVCIGIRPTTPEGETQPTGADFLVAGDGDQEAMRASAGDLDGVIQRFMQRRGIL